MRDGSDAIADWPILNALLNTSAGATWVSVHHGGGVGIGYSIHAGMVVVADGSREADEKLQRVLTCDPGLGVVRHADAGYAEAIDTVTAYRHYDAFTFGSRGFGAMMIPERPSLERRVLAALDGSAGGGTRIPVVLGGCGTGRTSLLLRLRDLIGRTSAQYVDVERIATTPERFLQVAARGVAVSAGPFGTAAARPKPARADAFDAALAFLDTARASRRQPGDVPARRVPRAADVRELSRAAVRAARSARRRCRRAATASS